MHSSSLSSLRLHWSLLGFLGVMAALFVARLTLVEDGSVGTRRLEAAWWAFTFGWGIHQYAYRKVDGYRLAIDRRAARIRNPSMQWGLLYELELSGAVGDIASDTAVAIEKGAVKELARGSRDRVWDVGGQVVQLRFVPATSIAGIEESGLLRLNFRPVTNSLRAWQAIIEDSVLPLVRRVEEIARPFLLPGNDPKITVRIVYAGRNPYFGYFVTRVEPSAVARVDIEYFETVADEEARVQVHEDRLEFVAPSLDSARRLSMLYLALEKPAA